MTKNIEIEFEKIKRKSIAGLESLRADIAEEARRYTPKKPIEEASGSLFCPECGTLIERGSFCPECGKHLMMPHGWDISAGPSEAKSAI